MQLFSIRHIKGRQKTLHTEQNIFIPFSQMNPFFLTSALAPHLFSFCYTYSKVPTKSLLPGPLWIHFSGSISKCSHLKCFCPTSSPSHIRSPLPLLLRSGELSVPPFQLRAYWPLYQTSGHLLNPGPPFSAAPSPLLPGTGHPYPLPAYFHVPQENLAHHHTVNHIHTPLPVQICVSLPAH